ncbi:NAD(P)-dependent oxidoreductase [Halobacteria archaeon AArc-m2/3/4]|uniref:NAD(P)-dependent oxidoreductase n=1 Tax=Natronoglomus mannanivorans TaxID=2979990 RepID=A0ABT2QJ83_9EURY|nr:NAD(P)-dependent oxidoreductase [Halobacteria archaeon AArc-m2/3/4]
MKVAVTGATGFIGQYVVKRLLSSGHTVVAIGRNETKLRETFSDEPVQLHVSDYEVESLRGGLAGADAVVHLAAKRAGFESTITQTEVFHTNIQLTKSVFRAALTENVQNICQSSSISVYSLSQDIPFSEEQRTMPPNMYGISKVMCENMADILRHNYDINIASLRISSVYGFGERSLGVFMTFVERARDNKQLVVHGQGKDARDFIYVRDVACAVEAAIESNISGVFNIGSGKAHSIFEIATKINEIFDNSGNLKFDKSVDVEPMHHYLDCSKAAHQLDWEAKYSLTEAIKDMKKIY